MSTLTKEEVKLEKGLQKEAKQEEKNVKKAQKEAANAHKTAAKAAKSVVKQENALTKATKNEAKLLKKLNALTAKHQHSVSDLEKAKKDLEVKRKIAQDAQNDVQTKTTRAVSSEKAKEQHTKLRDEKIAELHSTPTSPATATAPEAASAA